MFNLNEILERHARFYLMNKDIEYEMRLGDGFPELDEQTHSDYNRAFGQFYAELVDLRPLPTKVRITSKLENTLQKVWIEHNGNPLSQLTLEVLNSRLERVERDERIYITPGRHGNLIAAQILKSYGGKIRLSNIDDGEYKVRTTVEIPIQPNTPPNF